MIFNDNNDVITKLKTDKNWQTNALATALIGLGLLAGSTWMTTMGFFAFSGAITNSLAIYMLFEKVPYLKGSGVIPERFEEFKASIKQLMMSQFFTVQNIEQFIEIQEQQTSNVLNLQPLLDAVDYDKIYDNLVLAIMESSFGAMLLMMGGSEALLPLKEPFTEKMRLTLSELTTSEAFNTALHHSLNAHKLSLNLSEQIERVIDKRLNELTPELVKEMVQGIIREHLGWLVVWGGVLGGILGGTLAIFTSY